MHMSGEPITELPRVPTGPAQGATVELGEMVRLALKPGDMIVVTFPEPLSDADMSRLGDQLKRVFPDHPVLVLDSGAKLGVIEAEQ
jgi:hypothetical protein